MKAVEQEDKERRISSPFHGGVTPTTGSGVWGTYYCSSCGKYVDSSRIHVCGTYTSVQTPVTLKPKSDINWKEYIPAKPPLETGKYLIVVLTNNGKEILEASFAVDKVTKQQSWRSTKENLLIIKTVTHYASLDLP